MRELVLLCAVGAAWAALGCNDSTLEKSPAQPPVAVIESPAETFGTLDTAQLDGTSSYDPDNLEVPDAITEYRWSLVGRPTGSAAEIQPSPSGKHANLFVDLAGTYIVELVVVDVDGLTSEPAQFTLEGLPFEDVHVELSWDTDRTDLDVHLIHETDCGGGNCFAAPPSDCFFQNPAPDWGPAGPIGNATLDLDALQGFGPENVNVADPEEGTQSYRVVVNYYDDRDEGASTATVRIYLQGYLAYEGSSVLGSTGDNWDVATIQWPSGQVTPIGDVYDSGYPH